MKDADRATFHSLRAAQGFLQEYGHALGTIAPTGLVQRLDAIIAAAYEHLTNRAAAELHGHSLAWTEGMLRDHFCAIT